MAKSTARPRREILVVTHYYDAHGGGIERAAGRLISELAGQDGVHFTWAASAPETLRDETPIENDDVSLLPMKAANFLERRFGVPWPIWGLKSLRRLNNAVRGADIVWMHDAPYMGNIAAFWMARAAKKPVVITQHIGPVPYRNFLWRSLMAMADGIFTRHMLTGAQQTVFVSDWVADNYHRRFRFETPVRIIPNGVDSDIFAPATAERRQQLRNQLTLRDDQPVLLFVGRFIDKKGLPVIRHLTSMLPDWRFWLVGRGPIDPENWYQPNVHVFHGREGTALAELYQAADLLILPSYGEGFPLVVQEAMACGLPVICSPTTAAGSQLAKPFLLTATVDPSSPARTAVAWAARLKAQREYLPLDEGNLELAKAARHFWSWPKIAACYAEIFRDLDRTA
jgi:glycosyltransferase involved in cell wall biosynthesis